MTLYSSIVPDSDWHRLNHTILSISRTTQRIPARHFTTGAALAILSLLEYSGLQATARKKKKSRYSHLNVSRHIHKGRFLNKSVLSYSIVEKLG